MKQRGDPVDEITRIPKDDGERLKRDVISAQHNLYVKVDGIKDK